MTTTPKATSKARSKTTSKKTSAPIEPEDTITLNRSHFYAALVALAFSAGVLVGYAVWGRAAETVPQTTVSSQPPAQGPIAEAPVQTTSPQYVRYDIPNEGFPSLGPEDAPIVIVEFSDFQCPFCTRFHKETFQPLMDAYPGKIRFVYRHLPLTSIHPEAFPSAEASMCANEQGAFWSFHDKLFSGEYELGQDAYLQYARDLDLDLTAFEDCLTNHKYQDAVQLDLDFALNLGANSTPTFFINGLAVIGAQPLEAFKQVIDKELAGEIPE